MLSRIRRPQLLGAAVCLAALLGFSRQASAELVMKLLAVNPSETESKEFNIRSPLPPEVKPEHVLDADGLKVDYDSQAGVYVLVGKVTLKPKESITKRIVLEDVWVIPAEQFSGIRRETEDILRKLDGTPYEEQGKLLAKSIDRRLAEVEESQDEPFTNPMQHINRYRENLKTVEAVKADLTSLHQLMVMAAVQPKAKEPEPAVTAGSGKEPQAVRPKESALSMQTTWWLIFGILGVLGCVSVLFFLVWHRQLRVQMNKQATREAVVTQGQGASTDTLNLPPSPTSPDASPKI